MMRFYGIIFNIFILVFDSLLFKQDQNKEWLLELSKKITIWNWILWLDLYNKTTIWI